MGMGLPKRLRDGLERERIVIGLARREAQEVPSSEFQPVLPREVALPLPAPRVMGESIDLDRESLIGISKVDARHESSAAVGDLVLRCW